MLGLKYSSEVWCYRDPQTGLPVLTCYLKPNSFVKSRAIAVFELDGNQGLRLDKFQQFKAKDMMLVPAWRGERNANTKTKDSK